MGLPLMPFERFTALIFLLVSLTSHSSDSRIRIEIPATNRGSQVAAFDGDTLVRLENGDYIEITKAETVTRVVKLDHRSFLDILKMKMYDA